MLHGFFHNKKGVPPPATHVEEVGYTQEFVLAKGFAQVGNFDVLIGDDNTKRLFAEMTADRDRTDVRPIEAYLAILGSMHPGWKFRILQLYWPDPEPRLVFRQQVLAWRQPNEGMSILKDGLLLALDKVGLPFGKRTFLEFAYADEESLTWLEALPALCNNFGVHFAFLTRDDITHLSRWIFNPSLE